jgi:hypothetical protein
LNAYGGPYEPLQIQIREGNLLLQFFNAADRAGINIPGHDGNSFANALRWHPQNHDWPHQRAIPLLALAQHHGLPTRLLDWTRSGRIAAYFAAVAALSDADPGRSLEVWAMRCDVSHYYNNNAERQARVMTAPAWSNPNLRAQLGIFTICTGQIVRADQVVSLDEIVIEELAKPSTPCDDLPLLKRLQLPRGAAPRLLRLLSYEEITAATMFPGADGVVRALREQSTWDLPPKDQEF